MGKIARNLPNSVYQGAVNADSPSATNPLVTSAVTNNIQLQINALGNTDNILLTGAVSWSGVGLTYDVTACTYRIQGNTYMSPANSVTLSAADLTNDRIDVIWVNTSGVSGVTEGTPDPNPSKPVLDPVTHLEVTFITVAANTTEPVGAGFEDVYRENIEWTGSDTVVFPGTTFAETVDPAAGLLSTKVLNMFDGEAIKYTRATAYTLPNAAGSQLKFKIKITQDWTPGGFFGKRQLGIRFRNSTDAAYIGAPALLGWQITPGIYGFDPTLVNVWQDVIMDLDTVFGVIGLDTKALVFYKSTTGPAGLSFSLDEIRIEIGTVAPPLAAATTSADVSIPTDGLTTHMTNMEQSMNHMWSAASLNGFALTDNLDGTVDIAEGDALLRPTDVHDSQLKAYKIAATAAVALTNNDQNFIYVDYNAGTPQLAVTTNPALIDGRTQTPIFAVTRIGTTIHYVDIRTYTTDFMHLQTRKQFFTEGFLHEPGGSLIANGGTRYLDLSAGAFYLVGKRIPHIGFDTDPGGGADTFTRFSTADSGVTWTRTTGQTQVNNTEYNNPATGLVTLANNKFKVVWIYLILNDTDIFAVLEGQAEYDNAAAAEASTRPSIVPPELDVYSTGILVGRAIIEKSATEFHDVQTPFGDFLIGTAPQVAVSTFVDLTDTNIVAPVVDDVATYDGAVWVNSPSKGTVAVTLLAASWVADGNRWYQDIAHALATEDVDVTLYDTTSKETVVPDEIKRTDVNTVRIHVANNTVTLRALVSPRHLVVQGNSGRNVVLNPVSPYTAQNNDIIIWDATSGNKIVNLPAAAASANFRIDVKKTDATANTITVDPNGAELIEGGANAILTTQYEAISTVPAATEWWIIASM